MKFDAEFRDVFDLSQAAAIEKLAMRFGIGDCKGRDPHLNVNDLGLSVDSWWVTLLYCDSEAICGLCCWSTQPVYVVSG